MDPLSISTGILTVLGACSKVSRIFEKIQSLKEAPALIQAINNEVSELRLMLMGISDYLESQKRRAATPLRIDEAIFKMCTSTLDQVRNKVLQVESLLQYRILKPESYVVRVNRASFLRHYDQLVEMQVGLKETKQKITALSSLLGVRDVSRIEVILNDIRSHDLTMLLQSQQRIEDRLNSLVDLQTSNMEARNTPERNNSQALASTSSSNIAVSVSRVTMYESHKKCTCFRQKSSMRLQTFLGTLFIGYAAAPIVPSVQPECPHDHKRDIYFTYIFPSWLIRRAFVLHAQIDTSFTIGCSISFVQVISDNHVVWDLCQSGDLEGIRNLLHTKQISIKAQNADGKTLLEESLNTFNLTSVQFLVEAGADIYYETRRWGSAQKIAWQLILANTRSTQWRDHMRSIFPKPDFNEQFDLGPLHEAVLNLGNRSIESIMCDGAVEVNKMDLDGRTALWWAAHRGDAESIEALLRHRADCNKTDKLGISPLFFAVKRSIQCVRLLLEANADVNIKNKLGITALHSVLRSGLCEQDNMQIIELLVQAGAEVDAVNMYGETPLHHACGYDRAKVIALLMGYGADPRILTKTGLNVLCFATKRNHHSQLKVLLQHHEDHVGGINEYGTFIHLVADRADKKTLQMLAQQSHFRRRNMNVKNRLGQTPYQLAALRDDVDAEWRDAFFKFCRNIDKDLPLGPRVVQEPQNVHEDLEEPGELEASANASRDWGSRNDDSDDEFVDAQEG